MIEAAVREEVHRRGLFGETHRAVHPHQDDASADANGFRARSHRCGNRERTGHVAVVAEVVLAHPHVVEAEVLHVAGQIELLAIHVRPRPRVCKNYFEFSKLGLKGTADHEMNVVIPISNPARSRRGE